MHIWQMFKQWIVYIGVLSFIWASPIKAQERDTTALSEEKGGQMDTVLQRSADGKYLIDGMELNERQFRRYQKKLRKDSIRAQKNVWWSVFGGPSYTPEASFGVGGAVLASFKTNKRDSLLQRSFLPAGVNLSINGTIVVAGAGTFFFNQNRFRIYVNYGYRNEPSHYYGRGMEKAEKRFRIRRGNRRGTRSD